MSHLSEFVFYDVGLILHIIVEDLALYILNKEGFQFYGRSCLQLSVNFKFQNLTYVGHVCIHL